MYTVYSCMMPRKEFTYHQVLTLVCDTGVCSTSYMPWGELVIKFLLSFKYLWVNYQLLNKKMTLFLKLELLGFRPCNW